MDTEKSRRGKQLQHCHNMHVDAQISDQSLRWYPFSEHTQTFPRFVSEFLVTAISFEQISSVSAETVMYKTCHLRLFLYYIIISIIIITTWTDTFLFLLFFSGKWSQLPPGDVLAL